VTLKFLSTRMSMNLDWGNHGGHCVSDCLVLEPCCGRPCNVARGCYCFVCTLCCNPCVVAKIYATSLDQACTIGHCSLYLLIIAVLIGITIINTVLTLFGSAILDTISSVLYLCALVIVYFLIVYYATIIRVSLRRKFNIGEPGINLWDCFFICCCWTSPCATCQEFRSVGEKDWDWIDQLSNEGFGSFMQFVPHVTPRNEGAGGGASTVVVVQSGNSYMAANPKDGMY